jgi:hypothetical protein
MLEKINGTNFYGININTKEEVSIWRLLFLVSQRRKYTFGQIQEKMVWTI